MRSPFVSEEQLRNRLEITDIMESHGFMHFPFEFWHFSRGDVADQIMNNNAGPARFGAVNWDSATNEVTPVANAQDPLNAMPQIEKGIEAALKRLN